MKKLVDVLKSILLIIELAFAIIFYNWEKVLFLGVVSLDQITKAIVMRTFLPGESIPILQDIFHLTYILNPGAAFGILSNFDNDLFLSFAKKIGRVLAIWSYGDFERCSCKFD